VISASMIYCNKTGISVICCFTDGIFSNAQFNDYDVFCFFCNAW